MNLTNIEQVQKIVGKLPGPRDLKVIDFIDEHARLWLSYTNLAFIAFGESGNIRLTTVGGEENFVFALDSKTVRISLTALDKDSIVEVGLSLGALFTASGMEESLRINGKVSAMSDESFTLKVEECYLHCAKAFRRSNFWLPQSISSHDQISSFVRQAKFLLLASINSGGQVDVSPKGDPENFLIQEEKHFICFADRPGNRRIDSFRNIIEQPKVSIIALIPGCKDILELQGRAEICTDENLLQRFIVQGKKPKIVTKIAPNSIQIKPSKALVTSNLWPAKSAPEDLNPSEIFKSHVSQSKEKSLAAKIARTIVSVPGLVKKGLESDYKNNMY